MYAIRSYYDIDTLIKTDTPLFIHGSPGIGKSYIVADVAENRITSYNVCYTKLLRLNQLRYA